MCKDFDKSFHLMFLRRAVDLSRVSLASGGFPVAALLVKDGQEVAYGLSCTETSKDITAHGEMQAIRTAGESAVGPLTLYSSLEPCLMCLAASAWAGVDRIVFACRRTVVDAAYYVNTVDAEDAAKILTAPPQFIYMDDLKDEVLALIREYENRVP